VYDGDCEMMLDRKKGWRRRVAKRMMMTVVVVVLASEYEVCTTWVCGWSYRP